MVNASSVSITADIVAQDIGIGRLLIMSYLIFLMQCGFALLEAGTVRLKNVKNILLKNVVGISMSALVWFLWGFAFAWAQCGDSPFIGYSGFLLLNLGWEDGSGAYDNTYKQAYAHWIYSWAFSATTITIVGGAIAERTRFRAYVLYSLLLPGLIYPLVEYWIWSSNGWLSSRRVVDCATDVVAPLIPGSNGVLDFAGGLVVHVVGGTAALWGCVLVGPRLGRWNREGHLIDFTPNNPTHMTLGVLILWFGWFGFNTGYSGCIVGCAATVSRAAVNTTVAAGTSCLTVLVLLLFCGRPGDIAPTLNGILVGLVSITAPCGFVLPYAAMVIGFVGAFVFLGLSSLLRRLHVDDVVDAVAVHLGGGAWGTIALGLLATEGNVSQVLGYANTWGLFYGGGWMQLGMQVLGLVVVLVWVTILVLPFFWVLLRVGWLRASRAEEEHGLDFAQSIGHGMSLFDMGTWLWMRKQGGGSGVGSALQQSHEMSIRDKPSCGSSGELVRDGSNVVGPDKIC